MFQSMIRTAILAISALFAVSAAAQNPVQYLWGDQGNGTYINPVLNADYSDPDVIRVGKKFCTRVGLFCYNTSADGGMAMFDDFEYPINNR